MRKNQETWEEQQHGEEGQSGVVLVKSHNSIMDQTTSPQISSRLTNTTGTTTYLIICSFCLKIKDLHNSLN